MWIFLVFGLVQGALTPVYLLANFACQDFADPPTWAAVVSCITPWVTLQAYKQRKILPEFLDGPALLDPTLKIENNGGQPGQGLIITASEQMISLPKPNIMLGNSWSGVSMASNAFMSSVKELQLGYASTNAKLSNKEQYPYFMRVIAPDSLQSRALVKVLLKFGYNQVSCIHTDDGYAEGLAFDFRTFAKEDGITVSMTSLPYGSYDAWDVKIAAAFAQGNRVYVLSAVTGEVSYLWDKMEKAGMVSKTGTKGNMFLMTETFAWTVVDERTVGSLGVMPVSKGALWPDFVDFWKTFRVADLPASLQALCAKTVNGYTDANFENGEFPSGFYMPFAVDNMFAALKAMEGLAKKGIAGDQIRSDALKDEMYKLVFQGVSGPVAFDVNGDRLGDYEIFNHVKDDGAVKVDIAGLWGTSGVVLDKDPIFPDGTATPTPQRFPDCPAGTFGPGMPYCSNCTAGTANKVPGAEACVPCDRGFYSAGPGAVQCTMCPVGKEQKLDGQTSCTACAAGFFGKNPGQPECELCEPGFFSGVGTDKCTPCKIGTFASSAGSSECTSCPDTYTTKFRATARGEECTCSSGMFWNRAADKCDICQPKAGCPGGLLAPTVWDQYYGEYVGTALPDQIDKKEAGNWDPTKASGAFAKLLIYTCRPNECVPQPEKCQEYPSPAGRRVGIACAVCEEGYYLGQCRRCGSGGGFSLLIIFIALMPFGMWACAVLASRPYMAKANAAFGLASTFGIMAVFLQMLGMMGGFNVGWPIDIGAIFEFAKIFLLDLEGLGIGCLVGNGFAAQYYTSFLLPVLIGVCMVGVQLVSKVVPRIGPFSTKLDTYASLNFLGMFYSLLYISMVKMVVAYLECNPNPAAPPTLAKYKQVVCGSSEHATGTPACALGFIFYVIGFFALCLILNIKAPSNFVDVKFRSMSKFLVNRWRVDVWYWGSVYMTRNLLLAMVAVISSTAVDQFIMMGVLMLLFLVLAAAFMPWKDIQLARFDNIVSFIVVFACYCGVGFMHLNAERKHYDRDTSEIAEEARAEVDSRIRVFSILLAVNMGLAAFLFCALLVYCLLSMKNRVRLANQEDAKNKAICHRFHEACEQRNFKNQFNRFVEVGTPYDIRGVMSILTTMETRLGLDTAPVSLRTTRLKMSPALTKSLEQEAADVWGQSV